MNTFSKNSISIIVALLLVILLSESKLFFFFTETYLGRVFLILLILFASYLNKILGVVCVLILVIMFNNYVDKLGMEGFDNKADSDATSNTQNNTLGQKVEDIKNKISEKINSNANTTSSEPTSSTPADVPNESEVSIPSKINVITSVKEKKDSKNKANASVEGFDIQSTENNIKRGKQSNSIPVSPYLKAAVDVAPYEGKIHANSFHEGFSIF